MLAPFVNQYLHKRGVMDVAETLQPQSKGATSSVHGPKSITLQSIDLSQYYDTNLINSRKRQFNHSIESRKSKTNRNQNPLHLNRFKSTNNGDGALNNSMMSRYQNQSRDHSTMQDYGNESEVKVMSRY